MGKLSSIIVHYNTDVISRNWEVKKSVSNKKKIIKKTVFAINITKCPYDTNRNTFIFEFSSRDTVIALYNSES